MSSRVAKLRRMSVVGFRIVGDRMMTYTQEKANLTYFYMTERSPMAKSPSGTFLVYGVFRSWRNRPRRSRSDNPPYRYFRRDDGMKGFRSNCRFLYEIRSSQELYCILSVPDHVRSIARSPLDPAELSLYVSV